MEFWVSAKNCCDIEECFTQCLVLGHPTIWGVVGIIIICLIVGWLLIGDRFTMMRIKHE